MLTMKLLNDIAKDPAANYTTIARQTHVCSSALSNRTFLKEFLMSQLYNFKIIISYKFYINVKLLIFSKLLLYCPA